MICEYLEETATRHQAPPGRPSRAGPPPRLDRVWLGDPRRPLGFRDRAGRRDIRGSSAPLSPPMFAAVERELGAGPFFAGAPLQLGRCGLRADLPLLRRLRRHCGYRRFRRNPEGPLLARRACRPPERSRRHHGRLPAAPPRLPRQARGPPPHLRTCCGLSDCSARWLYPYPWSSRSTASPAERRTTACGTVAPDGSPAENFKLGASFARA